MYYHLVDMNKKSHNYSTSDENNSVGIPEIEALFDNVPQPKSDVKYSSIDDVSVDVNDDAYMYSNRVT